MDSRELEKLDSKEKIALLTGEDQEPLIWKKEKQVLISDFERIRDENEFLRKHVDYLNLKLLQSQADRQSLLYTADIAHECAESEQEHCTAQSGKNALFIRHPKVTLDSISKLFEIIEQLKSNTRGSNSDLEVKRCVFQFVRKSN